MYYLDSDKNYWEGHMNFIQFLLLIIAAENTIFLLTLLYFLFF